MFCLYFLLWGPHDHFSEGWLPAPAVLAFPLALGGASICTDALQTLPCCFLGTIQLPERFLLALCCDDWHLKAQEICLSPKGCEWWMLVLAASLQASLNDAGASTQCLHPVSCVEGGPNSFSLPFSGFLSNPVVIKLAWVCASL